VIFKALGIKNFIDTDDAIRAAVEHRTETAMALR
jgi:hypothetical protein